MWLALRSLFWTILLPGFFAGYLPWRYFGLRDVDIGPEGPAEILGVIVIALGTALLAACIFEFARSGRAGTISV